jgi:hypothetical protein
MTDEEFVIKFYEIRLEVSNEVFGHQLLIYPPWEKIPQPEKDQWMLLKVYRHLLTNAWNVQSFLNVWFNIYGAGIPNYANDGKPLNVYFEKFWQRIVSYDWNSASMAAAPTGDLTAPSVYKLKASGLKFIIQGWIEMNGQPKKAAIKFLHNGVTAEIVQSEFESLAVKLDP